MANDDPVSSERILHKALFTAEAERDDATAARAAVDLIWVVGVKLGRVQKRTGGWV